MSDFYNVQGIKKAKKIHKCECCNSEIQQGESYEIHAGKYEGYFFTFKICPICSKILSYWCHDLDNREFNLDELIGELWYVEKVHNLLLQIPHPSDFVKGCIEDYKQMQEEREQHG